jgi:microcystin-dependent protein
MWEGTIAEIRLFVGQFAPKYWAFCDGQTLFINQNAAMFSLLGTTFGGNGVNTFMLPKLADLAPGVRYVICLQGIFPQRP